MDTLLLPWELLVLGSEMVHNVFDPSTFELLHSFEDNLIVVLFFVWLALLDPFSLFVLLPQPFILVLRQILQI